MYTCMSFLISSVFPLNHSWDLYTLELKYCFTLKQQLVTSTVSSTFEKDQRTVMQRRCVSVLHEAPIHYTKHG